MDDESALIAALRAGDPTAFARLLDLHTPAMLRVARRYVSSHGSAEEAVPGRTPNTNDIGLETTGLTPGAWRDVDDTCAVRGVDGDWLYAMGDVNHRALLTHQGKYQARIAGNAIVAVARGEALDTAPWGAHVTTANTHAVPQAFFTDPEAGAVGLTLAEARQRDHRVKAVDVDMGATVPGANLYADGYTGWATGWARLIVELDHGHVLGASFVGPGVTELLHAATIAVAGQVSIERLWHAAPASPR